MLSPLAVENGSNMELTQNGASLRVAHVTNGARDDNSLIFKVAANSMSLSGSSFGVRIDFPRARESGRSKASKRWPP